MLDKVTCERDVVAAAREAMRLNALSARRGAACPEAARLARLIEEYDAESGNAGRGAWHVTAGGRRFWPFDPRPEDVDIHDIAHALGMLCRFSGHVKYFVSVAEHSVLVSRKVRRENALAGLLHDAAEAVLGDVVRPLKRRLPYYAEVEEKVMSAVCRRFGLDEGDAEMWRDVKRADDSVLSTEFLEAAQCGARVSVPAQPPLPGGPHLRFWPPLTAKEEFLSRYREITLG